jgi:hypothetical protein
MNINLDLLVPDWVLQYDTWREFLQVVQDSFNEVALNADDITNLYDLEKATDFIVSLARNFGFNEFSTQGIENNVQILDNQRGFIQWKGGAEFFNWLYQLFNITVSVRDLSKNVIQLSGGGQWDASVIEDGKYYRDGSVEITVPVAQYNAVKELEKFVYAGVMVYYLVITAVQYLEAHSSIVSVEADNGCAVTFDNDVAMHVCIGNDGLAILNSDLVFNGKATNWYMVANPFASIVKEIMVTNPFACVVK